jgi:uncharacterized protein (DUF362 family)
LPPGELLPGLVGVAIDERRDTQTPREAYDDEPQVAALVRRALLAAGLGRRDRDAPLRDIIARGATVLLKPNWVLDHNQANEGMECMITHPALICAALREVAPAEPGRIIIGDAPIQLCQFERVVTDVERARFAEAAGGPVDIVDFRRTVASSQNMTSGVTRDRRDAGQYVTFDLGADSLLEPVSHLPNRFRITNYDPRELARTHGPGRHQYLLAREPLDADVVLSLPKLKTHRKAGITGALKNLVGLNGSKEFLPHHRRGSVEDGGDCYATRSLSLAAAEEALDRANRSIGTAEYTPWHDRALKYWRRAHRRRPAQVEGSWHGNDTVWRMVLDLNRLLLYGRADGSISPTPVRRVYSLTDAIVAGHREGPMAPAPLMLGAVSFASDSACADLVHATLLGFDWRRIALVRESFGAFSHPVTTVAGQECRIRVAGELLTPRELAARHARRANAPAAWRGQIELEDPAAPGRRSA